MGSVVNHSMGFEVGQKLSQMLASPFLAVMLWEMSSLKAITLEYPRSSVIDDCM